MPHGALEELPTALCAEMGLLSPITKIGERVNKHSNLLCTQDSNGDAVVAGAAGAAAFLAHSTRTVLRRGGAL